MNVIFPTGKASVLPMKLIVTEGGVGFCLFVLICFVENSKVSYILSEFCS